MKQTGFDKNKTAGKAAAPGPAKKPILQTIVLGAISLASYVYIFKNERLVMETFTMGGWHTIFPILTAFYFSFVHGAFASNLLSTLGLEAKKK